MNKNLKIERIYSLKDQREGKEVMDEWREGGRGRAKERWKSRGEKRDERKNGYDTVRWPGGQGRGGKGWKKKKRRERKGNGKRENVMGEGRIIPLEREKNEI